MQQDFNDIELLFPAAVDREDWKLQKPCEPFSDSIIAFLNALSASLMKDVNSRAYPDVVTFAFFCRKHQLLNLKHQYQNDELRLGRGTVFHVAPSNVPVNFAYSLIAGLLSGNNNIVRVSSKEFPQVDLIVKHLYELSKNEEFSGIIHRIVLIRYDRSSNATGYFSSFCNVRVIWGGDETITQIRRNPLPSRSFDVTFADRYSLAVINADMLIKEMNLQKIAEGFYNDTYFFDQNACSAPHLIIWTGDTANIETAQQKFWNAVYEEAKRKYSLQTVQAIDKLTAFYRQAINMPVHKTDTQYDNTLVRIQLETLPPNIDEFRCTGGYFSEYTAASLKDIATVINSRYQTLAYYGYEKDILQQFVLENRLTGIDRIVPIGSTTNFTLTWDGYNLIDTLSRVCIIE
jgi:hypothetical protein